MKNTFSATTMLVFGGLIWFLNPQSAFADICVVGNSVTYQETGGDWLSMGFNDIDGSGGIGTDGLSFFGNYNATDASNQAFGSDVRNTPAYVSSFAAGANFHSIADQLSGYGIIDDPDLLVGTNSIGGVAVGFGSGAGISVEVFTFDVVGLASGQNLFALGSWVAPKIIWTGVGIQPRLR